MPLGIEAVARAFAKRSRRGLFAGKQVLFGNKVSEDGGNRSRRKWKPNVQNKKLFSELLKRRVRLRVTTSALRCIDKAGGLDSYILNTPDEKLASDVGIRLRWQLQHEQARQEALAVQKTQLLPAAAAIVAEPLTAQ